LASKNKKIEELETIIENPPAEHSATGSATEDYSSQLKILKHQIVLLENQLDAK
jgi:hypothetical protein